jgi:hypothetical protein
MMTQYINYNALQNYLSAENLLSTGKSITIAGNGVGLFAGKKKNKQNVSVDLLEFS